MRTTWMLLLVLRALAFAVGRSNAQMPDDVAQQIRSIGGVIDPKATGQLFASRVVDPFLTGARGEDKI